MGALSTLGNGLNHMPGEFKQYFLNNLAGGCDFDMKGQIFNDIGLIKTLVEGPLAQYGQQKFWKFLLGYWHLKKIRDIAGIGNKFALRMEANIGNFCSVTQLYHMFYCWMFDEAKFWRFLFWACNAGTTPAGAMHMTRVVEAFKQKHLLFTSPSVCIIKLGDPFPFCQPEE